MSKIIKIRNVPDALHSELKARAAIEGKSLSDYLLSEIQRTAERVTVQKLRERLNKRTPIQPSVSPSTAVREERDRQ